MKKTPQRERERERERETEPETDRQNRFFLLEELNAQNSNSLIFMSENKKLQSNYCLLNKGHI
jgi:hypothetical protein